FVGEYLGIAAVGIRLAPAQYRVVLEIRGDVDHQTGARCGVPNIPKMAGTDARDVIQIAIGALMVDTKAQANVVIERRIQHCLSAPHAVVTYRTLDVTPEFTRRLPRYEQNGATRRIAT